MWHLWWRSEMRIEVWWGNLNEGDLLEDLGIRDRILLTLLLKKSFDRAWNGLIWIWIGTSDGYL
jgi:hypothetical protein